MGYSIKGCGEVQEDRVNRKEVVGDLNQACFYAMFGVKARL